MQIIFLLLCLPKIDVILLISPSIPAIMSTSIPISDLAEGKQTGRSQLEHQKAGCTKDHNYLIEIHVFSEFRRGKIATIGRWRMHWKSRSMLIFSSEDTTTFLLRIPVKDA